MEQSDELMEFAVMAAAAKQQQEAAAPEPAAAPPPRTDMSKVFKKVRMTGTNLFQDDDRELLRNKETLSSTLHFDSPEERAQYLTIFLNESNFDELVGEVIRQTTHGDDIQYKAPTSEDKRSWAEMANFIIMLMCDPSMLMMKSAFSFEMLHRNVFDTDSTFISKLDTTAATLVELVASLYKNNFAPDYKAEEAAYLVQVNPLQVFSKMPPSASDFVPVLMNMGRQEYLEKSSSAKYMDPHTALVLDAAAEGVAAFARRAQNSLSNIKCFLEEEAHINLQYLTQRIIDQSVDRGNPRAVRNFLGNLLYFASRAALPYVGSPPDLWSGGQPVSGRQELAGHITATMARKIFKGALVRANLEEVADTLDPSDHLESCLQSVIDLPQLRKFIISFDSSNTLGGVFSDREQAALATAIAFIVTTIGVRFDANNAGGYAENLTNPFDLRILELCGHMLPYLQMLPGIKESILVEINLLESLIRSDTDDALEHIRSLKSYDTAKQLMADLRDLARKFLTKHKPEKLKDVPIDTLVDVVMVQLMEKARLETHFMGVGLQRKTQIEPPQ